jgi:hypothetical protein
MPPPGKTAHRTVADTALPYVTNSSVISTDPQYIGGTNCMTSLRDWVERRPGFSATIETAATAFTNLQRQFVWRRWTTLGTAQAGTFFWMGCDIVGGTSKVYKMALGIDASAVLLTTSASAEPFDFVVSNNTCYMGNGSNMYKYDGTNFWLWGIVAPALAPSIALVAGVGNVYVSRCYVYTYFNSTTQHESSPSPVSTCTGVFATKQVNIGVVASTDPQVDQIRIYVTPDGGPNDPPEMIELPNSPFPNATTTYTDNRADDTTLVSLRNAPAFFQNDPPLGSFLSTSGWCYSQGRIWTFNGNNTYYSGFEEITNGVPEECFPGGADGNFYKWDNEVTCHAALPDGLAVYTPERIFKIEGDSLDTFRRYTLLQRRGTRSRTAVASLGGSVAWLDTSNTFWVSDMGEIGLAIRPDLRTINPAQAFVAIHIAGLLHWVTLLDGSTGKLFVYDLDRSQWMPPWTLGTTASALASGETSVGTIDLLVARNRTKALKLVAGTYLDDSSAYTASLQSNMYRLTPDGNPSWPGVLDWVELKTDSVLPSDVLQLTDADPTIDPYTSIVASAQPSPSITSSANLKTTRYSSNTPTAQMGSLEIMWPAVNSNFKMYQVDWVWHPTGM